MRIMRMVVYCYMCDVHFFGISSWSSVHIYLIVSVLLERYGSVTGVLQECYKSVTRERFF
jgi:hypothetical protein